MRNYVYDGIGVILTVLFLAFMAWASHSIAFWIITLLCIGLMLYNYLREGKEGVR